MSEQLVDIDPPKPAALLRNAKAYFDGTIWRDGRFWYDEATADKAAVFFPSHLTFTEGEWAGRPFTLEPWEEHDIVRPLFGWKRADGTRRYRRAFVWVARKNGKTELAAGIAMLMLLGDAEFGGQVFSIASEREQAGIVFNKASAMVLRSPSLQKSGPGEPGLNCLRESIFCPPLNASFRPLSGKAKGKHGLNMSGLIGDEIHEWPNGDLYTFVHDSAASRRQPLEFLISTAGQKGTYGEETYKECQAILAGDIDDPSTLVVIYAPDDDDDWTKEETWRKANPNWGKSVKVDEFIEKFNRARQLPRLENNFRRYQLNMWTDQAVRWLPMDSVDDNGVRFGWDHCKGPIAWNAPEYEGRLKGKLCFGGLDLSSTNDLSALVWWFPIQDGLDLPAVLCRFFKPGDLLQAHARRDRLPYDRWKKEGALSAPPGNVLDYNWIKEQVLRDAKSFRLGHAGNRDRKADEGGLAIDRWNATQTAVELQQEGIPVVLFGQGFASMGSPSKELERLCESNAFHHGDHPILRRHAQVVAVETSPRDDIKPVKSDPRSRIDGVVALVNALGIAAKGTKVPPKMQLIIV